MVLELTTQGQGKFIQQQKEYWSAFGIGSFALNSILIGMKDIFKENKLKINFESTEIRSEFRSCNKK